MSRLGDSPGSSVQYRLLGHLLNAAHVSPVYHKGVRYGIAGIVDFSAVFMSRGGLTSRFAVAMDFAAVSWLWRTSSACFG